MRDFKYNYRSQSGMYRERITVQRLINNVDRIRQQVEQYETVQSFWAMVKTSSNREQIREGTEHFEIDKRFVVRYNGELMNILNSERNTFVILHEDIRYDVKEAINDNELNETITIRLRGIR